MKDLITLDYEGMPVTFTEDGFFNATEVAAKYGKKPAHWLRTKDAKEYIDAMIRFAHRTTSQVAIRQLGIPRGASFDDLVVVAHGGADNGTWLHPKLAVAFARWLNPDFAVWCDDQIDLLIHGQNPTLEMKNLLRDLEVQMEQWRGQAVAMDAVRRTLERATRVTERALPKPLPTHKDAKLSPVAEQINKAIWANLHSEVPLSSFHVVHLTDEDVIKYASEVSFKKTTLGLINGALTALAPRGGQPVDGALHAPGLSLLN